MVAVPRTCEVKSNNIISQELDSIELLICSSSTFLIMTLLLFSISYITNNY